MVEITRFVTDCATVRYGVRFPSAVTVRQSRFLVRPRSGNIVERRVARVEQVYDDYRFFGVETAERIRRLSLDSDAPP